LYSVGAAHAQIIVHDPAVLANAVRIVLIAQDEIREGRKALDVLVKMGTKGPSAERYRTPTILALRHDPSRYHYGSQILLGLNSGDRVGELLMANSYPLAPSLVAVARLTPAQQRAANAQLATIDIAESIAQRAMHQVALARGFDSETAKAIEALDDDIMNPRSALHYLTAEFGKLAGGALIRNRQQAVSNQLTSHILEQELVESKRRRDAEAETVNMEINRVLYGRDAARLLTRGMTADLRAWRLP
jgi:hypothetical protein